MLDASNRPHLNNKQVADVFRTIGDLLLILGENRYVILAYQNAVRTIEDLNGDINAVAAAGTLEDLPKIGKAIAEKIQTLLETGTLPYYDELKAQVPAGVVAMMQVPDVGPKTVQRLWKELGITSVEAMKVATQEGKIQAMKGFGSKTEARILKSIQLFERHSDDRTPLGIARPLAQALVQGLQESLEPGILEKIEIVGSLRRWRETIADLDLLAVSSRPQKVTDAFQNSPQAVEILDSRRAATSIALPNGLQAKLRVVEARHWGAALCYFSGSQAHNSAIQKHARQQGWRLDESCLTAQNHPQHVDGTQHFFENEEDLYEFLGLQWVPPEMREACGEIAAALCHELPQLITEQDILGELHGHTTWSDGKASVAEMAEAARNKGYRYWNVSDHSIGLGVTQGVDADALAAQRQEIDALNERYAAAGIDFRLIQGTEVEILAHGELGLPDEVLSSLDVVVASIHSGQRQDREMITDRCLKAIHNPHVDMLGHPTGRLLGRRPASDIDVERILQACADTGTVVEINANPARLDLNDRYARRAIALGCKVAINTDAHSTDELDLMPYGIHTARRAWLCSEDVVNTRPLDELFKLLKTEA